MPSYSTLLVFLLAASALTAVPGPAHVYIVTRGIAQGRRAAVVSAFGVETATVLHVAAAAGLSAVLASSAVAFSAVKWLGVAYLLYLGVSTLLRADEGPGLETRGEAQPLGRVYLQGFITNALNPKVALFFLAFLPQFVDPSRGAAATQTVVLGGLMSALGLCSNLLYAVASGAVGRWFSRRPAFVGRQRYFAGSVYLALALAAAVTGGRQRG